MAGRAAGVCDFRGSATAALAAASPTKRLRVGMFEYFNHHLQGRPGAGLKWPILGGEIAAERVDLGVLSR
jgi:hypothetical protein